MKLFFDLLPIILFFVAYKMGGKDEGIYLATKVLMIAMSVQVAGLYFIKGKVEKTHIFTLLAILILGGLTLFLRDERFVMWKPTIVNWILGIVFFGSQFVGEKSIVKRMLEQHFEMPDKMWNWTNASWAIFFFVSGLLNLAVAPLYAGEGEERVSLVNLSAVFGGENPEATWVNFKLFGLTALSFIFMAGLIFALKDYLKDLPPEDEEEEAKDSDDKKEEITANTEE